MFRIKICGVTSVEDALVVADAGGDAIGLNFYAGSPRVCSQACALQIVKQASARLLKVGVFVNASADEIRQTVTALGLDLVQLHGDEPPELLHQLRGIPIIRAFRPGTDFAAVGEYLRRCHALTCMPRMVLVDGRAAGAYGGTGTTADWQAIDDGRGQLAGEPLILAGGLTHENVEAAIAAVHPWAVDVASGVEQSPGKKSAERVRAFVERAKAAFARSNAAR